MWRHLLRAAQVAHDLHVHIRPEVRFGIDLLEGRHRPLPAGLRGAVDQDVHPAEVGDGLLHHRADRVVVARVCRDRHDVLARRLGEFGSGRLQRLSAPSDERHVDALRSEGARDGLPDAATTARDDRALAGQLQVHGRPSAGGREGDRAAQPTTPARDRQTSTSRL